MLGDLSLGQPAIVSELDRLALHVSESRERLDNGAAQCYGVGSLRPDCFVCAGGYRRLVPLAQSSLMGPAAQDVDCTITCNTHEPPWDAPTPRVVRLSAVPRA